MTRMEALRRLEGTWSFDVVGDTVLLRDVALLATVRELRREREEVATGDAPAAVSPASQGAAASGD